MKRLQSWFWLPLALVLLAAGSASAQERKARKPKGKRAEVKVQAEGGADQGGGGTSKEKGASKKEGGGEGDGETKDAPRGLAADSGADAGEIRKEGDTEVKVMEFTGLDIEGQLKTPQMLYFLNRLRAEFGRPRLPHRSFMPELKDSAHDGALK